MTAGTRSRILGVMGGVCRRLATVAMVLVTVTGHGAVCAQLASPADRMACCVDDARCPMHQQDADGTRSMARTEVDVCCATPASGTTEPAVAPVVWVASTPRATTPAPWLLSDSWRRPYVASSPPAAAVPRHLLLSVLLV